MQMAMGLKNPKVWKNGSGKMGLEKFQEKRNEVNTLRCIVYGYESIFCKKNFGK